MLSYDLAVYDSIIYSASFYGGLIRSLDWGESWENLFPSQLDSINVDSVDYHTETFSRYTNRFFSVAVDSSAVGDTFSVWAGTASGIYRFIYNSWSRFGWQRSPIWNGHAAFVDGSSADDTCDFWLISDVINCATASACWGVGTT